MLQPLSPPLWPTFANSLGARLMRPARVRSPTEANGSQTRADDDGGANEGNLQSKSTGERAGRGRRDALILPDGRRVGSSPAAAAPGTSSRI